jgi:uncharacterized Zn finger protein
VLESYGLGPHVERGRRYARGGRVQGSRATPYRMSVRCTAPSKAHPSKAQ